MIIFLLMAGASCYGLLYGAFCFRQRRVGPGIAMAITGLFPLGFGVLFLIQSQS